MGDEIVVATVNQRVDQINKGLRVSAEGTSLDRLIDTTESAANVATIAFVEHLVLRLGHLLNILAEDEHVINANFFSDLDIGAVHRADD